MALPPRWMTARRPWVRSSMFLAENARESRILAARCRALQRLFDAGDGFGLGVDALAAPVRCPCGVGLALPRLHERQVAAGSDEAGVGFERVLEVMLCLREAGAMKRGASLRQPVVRGVGGGRRRW